MSNGMRPAFPFHQITTSNLDVAILGQLLPANLPLGDDFEPGSVYRSLKTEDGKSCCAMHDCAPAEARMRDGHWEVCIFPYNADAGRWFAVEDHAVQRRENPDGRPILCRTPNGFIRCFVPAPGT